MTARFGFLRNTGLPRTFWLLFAGTIVNRLGGFVVPFLALYLTGPRGLPVGQAALIVSLFGGGSFAASLVGGDLSDRLGRRPVMLMSFMVAPAAMMVVGLARSPGDRRRHARPGFSPTSIDQPSTPPSPISSLARTPASLRLHLLGHQSGAAIAPLAAGLWRAPATYCFLSAMP
jgi:MFS family permease